MRHFSRWVLSKNKAPLAARSVKNAGPCRAAFSPPRCMGQTGYRFG